MLKEVIQISIIILLSIFCYDIYDIYKTQLNSKKEKQLLIVKREIEGTNKLVTNSATYEAPSFQLWPAVLGISGVFCFFLFRYSLPIDFPLLRKAILKAYKDVYCKKQIDKKTAQTENSDLLSAEYVRGDSPVCAECSTVINQNSQRKTKVMYNEDNSRPTERNKMVTEKSEPNTPFIPLTSKLGNIDILPFSPTLNFLNNEGLSPSVTSLLNVDCVNNMEFSIPHSLFNDESRTGQHQFPELKKLYENNNEILAMKNKLIEEASLKSEDSIDDDISLLTQNHVMELLSFCNSNFKVASKSISEKATCTQSLTYTDSDIINLEKRLECVEHGLKQSENITKEWSQRINVVESELIDLHEQMYTILSKLEEERLPNYIIVSQVSKELQAPRKIEDDGDYPVSNVNEKREDFSQGTSSKRRFHSESEFNVDDYQSQSRSNQKINDEDNSGNSDINDEVIKKKSVALEAILERNSEVFRKMTSFSKKDKQNLPLSVPPHIVAPYKRSTFTRTDSKNDLCRVRKKIKNTTLK